MAFEDALGGSYAPGDDGSSVSADLIIDRLMRKALVPAERYTPPAAKAPTAPARAPAADFGQDDAVVDAKTPSTPARQSAPVDFGNDDLPATPPLPRARNKTEAPNPVPERYDVTRLRTNAMPNARADFGAGEEAKPEAESGIGRPLVRPDGTQNWYDTSGGSPGGLPEQARPEAERQTPFDKFTPPGGVGPDVSKPAAPPAIAEMKEPPVSPLEDAPFRSGGSVLDTVAGADTGMLSGEEAFKAKQERLAAATAAVPEARARVDQAKLAHDEMLARANLTGTAADAGVRRELRRQSGLGAAEQDLKEAEAEYTAAQKSPLPTQGSVRDTLERIPGTAADQIVSTARGAARLITGGYELADQLVAKKLGIKPHSEFFSKIDDALDSAVTTINEYGNQRLFKSDVAQNERFGSKLVNGVVSTGVFAGGGALGKAAGLSIPLTTAVLGALPQAEGQYQQARQAQELSPQYAKLWLKDYGVDVSEKTANGIVKWGMFASGLGIGATEAVPIGHLFERLEKASGGGLTRYLGVIAAQTGEEGIQEGIQQLLENAAVIGLLDPNRDIGKDVAENALVGAFSGMIVTGVMAAPHAIAPSVQQVQGRIPAGQNLQDWLQQTLAQANQPAAAATPPAPTPVPTPATGEGATPSNWTPTKDWQEIPADAVIPQGVAYEYKNEDGKAFVRVPAGPAPGPEAAQTPAQIPLTNPLQETPAPTPQPPGSIPEAPLLRAYGYTDEQIDAMSPTQRAAEAADARAAGVEPEAESEKSAPISSSEVGQPPAEVDLKVNKPAPKGPELYTLTDPLGATHDGQTIQVQVIRRDGKIEALVSDIGVTKVAPAHQHLSAEAAIAHTLGDHPMGAKPDLSKVRPAGSAGSAETRLKGGLNGTATEFAAGADWKEVPPNALGAVGKDSSLQTKIEGGKVFARKAQQERKPVDADVKAAGDAIFGEEDHTAASRHAPIELKTAEDVAAAGAMAARDHSGPQGEARNRQLGHATWRGLNIKMEAPAGGVRRGVDKDGKPWEQKFTHAYGDIAGITGKDGDKLDVYIGANPGTAKDAYVLNETDTNTGKHRQTKSFIGFGSEAEARAAYLGTSGKKQEMIGGITSMPAEDFPKWARSHDHTKPIRIQKAQAAKPARPTGPLSLLQFLASRGGLKPDPGGELKALGLTGRHRIVVPGLGFRSTIRPDGMSLDRARELAVENDYLHDAGRNSGSLNETTPNDLLDLIADERAGKRTFRQGEEHVAADQEAKHAQESAEDQLSGYRDEITAAIADAGVDPGTFDKGDIDRAAEIMAREGLDAEDALERAIMRAAVEDGLDTPAGIDETYGPGAYDAIQPPAARGRGEEVSPEGPEVQEPRQHDEGGREIPGHGQGADTFGEGDQAAPDEGTGHERPAATRPHRPSAPSSGEHAETGEAVRPAEGAAGGAEFPGHAEGVTFRTAKGSTYTVHEDGTTTRDKAYRPEHGEAEQGPQPRSAKTVYLNEKDAQRLAPPASGHWRVVFADKSNHVSLAMENKDGNWGIAPSQRMVPFSTEPTKDSVPLELWNEKELKGRRSYGKAHFGNAISEVMQPGENRDTNASEAGPELTRKGPWDFVKTWPAPDEARVAALQREGRSLPFDPNDADEVGESIMDALDEMANAIDAKAHDDLVEITKSVADIFGPEVADAMRAHAQAAVDRGPIEEERGLATEEKGAEGKPQLVIPGAEKISEAEQAQRKADEKLKPKVAQKPADQGLFGDESKQTDLLDLTNKPPPKPATNIPENIPEAPATPGPSDSDLPEGFKIAERTRQVKGGSTETAYSLHRTTKGGSDAFLGIFKTREEAIASANAPVPVRGKWAERAFPASTTAMLKAALEKPNVGEPIKEKMRAEIAAREAQPSPESWWSKDLTPHGREMVALATGMPAKQAERIAKASWQNIVPGLRDSLAAIRGTDRDPMKAAEAPTWAEVLAALPKDDKGKPDLDVAGKLMREITGTKDWAYDKLTPSQKTEVLRRVKDGAWVAVANINKPAETPKPKEWTEIGKNATGQTLYEDQRGVRSYVENGVRSTEPVHIIPTHGGVSVEASRRAIADRRTDAEWLLTSEAKAPPATASEKPAETSTTPAIDADVKSAFDDIFGEEVAPKPKAAPKQPTGWTAARPPYASDPVVALQSQLPPGFTASRNEFGYLRVEGPNGYGIESKDPKDILKDVRKVTKGQTKTELASSAAKGVGRGTKKSIDALGKLFGGKKLSMGISFDPDTYAQAKPLFLEAAADFAGAWRDVAELARKLVDELKAAGYGMDVLREMRPYLERFVQDVKDGTVDLAEAAKGNNIQGEESADVGTGTQGARPPALDNVPPAEGRGPDGGGETGRGAAGSGEPGADGNRAPHEGPALPGARGEGGGPAEVHPPAAGGAAGKRAGSRAGGAGARVSGKSAGPAGREPASPVKPEAAPSLPAINFKITDETELGKGSEAVKFRDNVAAIETLKRIEEAGRRANADEQRALARFVGWGGLANAFRAPETQEFKPDWKDRGEELEQILTPDEIREARRTTRNAHYTSKTVVDAMWNAARHLGFKGGLALEMSAGVGNFLGLKPDDINARFIAIEYDGITARIAKLLYPQDVVLNSGTQKVPLPDGEAVLNIGNPPFGSEGLRWQHKPELVGLSIHNQFFLAGLDALRPGGLQIMVVSRYLMDAQDASARQKIAAKADLLGAIRLPDTAFRENARTEVVTDILFLQRRDSAGEKRVQEAIDASHARPEKNAELEKARKKLAATVPSWVKTGEIKDPLGGEPMVVSQHYIDNPHMVMGRLERSGEMRRENEVNVKLEKGADLGALLNRAVAKLPANKLDLGQEVMDATLARHKSMGASLEIAVAGHEVGHVGFNEDGNLTQVTERETPAGGYEVTKREITPESPWSRELYMDKDERWYVLEPQSRADQYRDHIRELRAKADEAEKTGDRLTARSLREQADNLTKAIAGGDAGKVAKIGSRRVYERKYFDNNVVPAGMRLGQAKYDRLKEMATLRDLTKKQLTLESQDAAEKEMEANRAKLAKAYKDFVGQHGLLNEQRNTSLASDMPDGALVLALEVGYRAPVTIAKAKRTGDKPKPASATPAPILSRRVVPKYEAATRADNPADALSITLSERGFVDMPRIAQLLGQTEAEASAKLTEGDKPLVFKDPETGAWETANGYLSGHVAKKLAAAKQAGLDANVKALEAVQPAKWTAENVTVLMGSNWVPPQHYADFVKHLLGGNPRVEYAPITNNFNMLAVNAEQVKEQQWSTKEMPADSIIRGLLNSKLPKVYETDDKGQRTGIDKEATALVQLKAREIENEWADWVFKESARRNDLVKIYNEKFNTRVHRQHDGSHLTLPGKVPDEVIRMRRHQLNAIWRGISQRFTLLDHVVGAGKAQPLDAKVLTPTGWKRMGDIEVGDLVIAGDGTATRVTGVFPQGEKDIYRVGFSDGAATECCDEHLWLTQTYRERSYSQRGKKLGKAWNCGLGQVRQLSDIRATLTASHLGAKNHSVPIVEAVKFAEQPVPIGPYLMGVLLGDGCFTHRGVAISLQDEEIIEACRPDLPQGATLGEVEAGIRCRAWTIIGNGRKDGNPVKVALDTLGLRGLGSADKFIPDTYKINSAAVRLAVLQGLLDTDGSVSKRGHSIYFYSVSDRLADDVVFLVQSLGGTVRRSVKQPHYVYNGERHAGAPAHILCLNLPASVEPFRLSRKAALVKPKTKYAPVRYIVAVEPVGRKSAQCIAVEHPSHLYVTDDFIVTHNTFTAIARAMERRRMGLSRKPMIVVPNHLVSQWTADVYRLYPGAKVLAAGTNQFDRKGRRRLFAKIATGDYDIVIVPHSSFGFIGIAKETEIRFLEAQLKIAMEAVKEAEATSAAEGGGGFRKPFTVKEAERLVTTIENRMDAIKGSKHDNMLTFEQMGVDDLTVDEAHEFKNLFYSSNLAGVRGMGTKTGSKKAFDLYTKIRVLRETPTGTVTFMSGTPISNSAVEMYTMMRYLAADELKELGLEHFDAWRTQYVSASLKFEPTESGGLKEVTRLGRQWSNMRSLMELYYSFTDAVPQEDITKAYAEDNKGARFPVPKVKNGGRKEVVVKPTEAQVAELQRIIEGFDHLPSIQDPDERNITRLKLMDQARKVSLDVRAVNKQSPSKEENGKLDQIADNVARIHKAWTKDAGAQLVFLDRGVKAGKTDAKTIKEYDDLAAKRDAALAANDEATYRDLTDKLDLFDPNEIEEMRRAQAGGWNAYDQLKQNLIKRGIPPEEIRFVQEANNDAEKKAIFDAVNEGTVRVLIGSTPKMGAGTNVQERLVALHHGDVTWKPSDIEQREGRIIRQGNWLLNKYGPDVFEVEILAYVTERSVDAKMWDLNATKLKMINGIRKYDGAFTMEFDDEDAVGMAEIAALASGDPLLLERVKLMAEIDKLELLQRAHQRKFYGLEDSIEQHERAIRDYPAKIRDVEARAEEMNKEARALDAEVGKRAVTVEGNTFSEATGAMREALAAIELQKGGEENAKYSISIDGQRYTNQDGIREAIHNALGDTHAFAAEVGGVKMTRRSQLAKTMVDKVQSIIDEKIKEGDRRTIPLGRMLNADLELDVRRSTTKDSAFYDVGLALTRNGRTLAAAAVTDDYGKNLLGYTAQAARGLVDRLQKDVDDIRNSSGSWYQHQINQANELLPGLLSQRGQPFKEEAQLKAKFDRLNEVIGILDARTKAAEGKGQNQGDGEAQVEMPKGAALSVAVKAPGFYSAVFRALENAKQSRATPEQWIGFLNNAPGVKAEERQWLGIDEWLKSHTGPVAKGDIYNYLKANQIQLQEVEQGGKPVAQKDIDAIRDWLRKEYGAPDEHGEAEVSDADLERLRTTRDASVLGDLEGLGVPSELLAPLHGAAQASRDIDDWTMHDTVDRVEEGEDGTETWFTWPGYGDESGGTGIMAYHNDAEEIKGYATFIKGEFLGDHETFEQATGAVADAVDNRAPPPTKFGVHTLPGGENYRELLLTLPMKEGAVISDRWQARQEPDGSWMPYRDGKEPFAVGTFRHDRAWAEETARNLNSAPPGPSFTQSHWSEPNVLAHVRFNDRTIDGKRTLFLEEVQSDWHQRGKRAGYGRGDEARRQELLAEQRRLTETNGLVSAANIRRFDELTAELGEMSGRVPDAPFKTTWPELVLKRMIRYAVENGYDQVAWTSGSVQATNPKARGVDDEASKKADRGLRVFYDEILPAAANKLVKKFGARVGTGNLLGAAEPTNENLRKSGRDAVIAHAEDGSITVEDTKTGAVLGSFREDQYSAAVQLANEYRLPPTPVHTLEITPALRSAAMAEGFPMFKVGDGGLTPVAEQRRADIESMLTDIVRHVAGRGVRVRFEQDLGVNQGDVEGWKESGAGRVIYGHYIAAERLITLSLSSSPNEMRSTALHEAFHDVEVNLLDEREMEVMARETDRMRSIVQRGFGLTDQELADMADYEVRARAFELYAVDRANGRRPQGLLPAVVRAFERLLQFFRAIRNGLNRMGFQTHEDIFGRALAGEMANRPQRPAHRRGFITGIREGEQQPAHAAALGPTPGPAQAFRPVYEEIKAEQGGISTVYIGDIIERTGLPKDVVHEALLESQRRGEVTLHGSSASWVKRTKAQQEGAFPAEAGKPDDSRISTVVFKDNGAYALGPRRVRPRTATLPLPTITMPHESVREALHDPTLSRSERLSAALDALLLTPSRNLWDKLIDISRLQRSAEMATGAATPERLDTYLAASLYPGRAGERMKDASRELFQPLFDEMKKQGVERDQLHLYLYARHAEERNEQIRGIDPANDSGSGMTDDEARMILDDVRTSGAQARFNAVAELVDAIVQHNRDLMEREGLEHASTILKWTDAYDHYVPLKGAEGSDSEQFDGGPSIGTGFNVRGAESRRALGRFDRAGDILANLLDQTQRTIIRAEKNRVGKAFLRFAQRNPSPLYRFGLAEQRRQVNPTTGLVEMVWVTTANDAANVFAVKVAGKVHYVKIEHEGLVTALKNIGMERLPGWARLVASFTRQYSAFQTARNPEFVLTNLMRDLQDAGLSLTAEQQKGFKRAFAKNLLSLKSLRGAVLGQFDKTSGHRWARLHEEWRLAGGKISMFGWKDIQTMSKEIQTELDRRTESMTKKVLAQPWRTVNPFSGHVVKFFEALSDVTETMTRLAVYGAARDIGLTQAQSAKAARSMTVDFNAQGKYGPWLKAFYAFSGPAIQGTVNLLRRLRRSRVIRAYAGGVATAGFALTLWNLAQSAGGGDDDDDKRSGYERKPYWEREKNILIYVPGQKDPLKIPMGYALQPFFMMGENAAMAFMGKTKPAEAFMNWLGTTAKAFNPVGGEGSIFSTHFWLGALTPTVIDPLVELGRNRNWLNRPIHPDEMPWSKGKPHSEQSKVTTSPFAMDAAELMNRVSGGNKFKKGAVDLYPDDLEYSWNFALGGFGKFITNSGGFMRDKIDGVDTPVERIPFVRRFVSPDKSLGATRSEFYEKSHESQENVATVRDAIKAEKLGQNVEDAGKTIRELENKVGMGQGPRGGQRFESESIYRGANRELQELRLREREIRNSGSILRTDRGKLLEQNHAEQLRIMRGANRDFRNLQPAP